MNKVKFTPTIIFIVMKIIVPYNDMDVIALHATKVD